MAIRVLVVDDRTDVRLSLLLTLEASGFDVTEAANATEAVESAVELPVDVILTDLYLPGFDGPALLDAVRATNHQHPKIIAMADYRAGRNYAPSLNDARAIGAEAVLQRPFNRTDLLEAIGSQPKELEPLPRQWRNWAGLRAAIQWARATSGPSPA